MSCRATSAPARAGSCLRLESVASTEPVGRHCARPASARRCRRPRRPPGSASRRRPRWGQPFDGHRVVGGGQAAVLLGRVRCRCRRRSGGDRSHVLSGPSAVAVPSVAAGQPGEQGEPPDLAGAGARDLVPGEHAPARERGQVAHGRRSRPPVEPAVVGDHHRQRGPSPGMPSTTHSSTPGSRSSSTSSSLEAAQAGHRVDLAVEQPHPAGRGRSHRDVAGVPPAGRRLVLPAVVFADVAEAARLGAGEHQPGRAARAPGAKVPGRPPSAGCGPGSAGRGRAWSGGDPAAASALLVRKRKVSGPVSVCPQPCIHSGRRRRDACEEGPHGRRVHRRRRC